MSAVAYAFHAGVSGVVRVRHTAVVLCSAVACVLSASGAGAQDTMEVRLVGEVREYSTDRPLADIAVKILELDRVALTDRNGFFAFDDLPLGRWTFEATGFGFATNTEASENGPHSLLLIRLESVPVEIEGLFVSVVQRLVRRRLAAPSRVWAWDRPELEVARAPDVGAFVYRSGVAVWVPCGGEFAETDLPNCYMHRGQARRVSIFLNDEPVMGAVGTSQLWAFDPRDLWSVEFLPSCRQLRVYTRQFMEWVEEGRVRLKPSLCM